MLTMVYRYDVAFIGMVLPGDELNVNIYHTSMQNGNIVVKVTMLNAHSEKILEDSVEVSQPTTVYVLTRQGSQGAASQHVKVYVGPQ
jgi:fatty acid synthase subunit alpha, fungi type